MHMGQDDMACPAQPAAASEALLLSAIMPVSNRTSASGVFTSARVKELPVRSVGMKFSALSSSNSAGSAPTPGGLIAITPTLTPPSSVVTSKAPSLIVCARPEKAGAAGVAVPVWA